MSVQAVFIGGPLDLSRQSFADRPPRTYQVLQRAFRVSGSLSEGPMSAAPSIAVFAAVYRLEYAPDPSGSSQPVYVYLYDQTESDANQRRAFDASSSAALRAAEQDAEIKALKRECVDLQDEATAVRRQAADERERRLTAERRAAEFESKGRVLLAERNRALSLRDNEASWASFFRTKWLETKKALKDLQEKKSDEVGPPVALVSPSTISLPPGYEFEPGSIIRMVPNGQGASPDVEVKKRQMRGRDDSPQVMPHDEVLVDRAGWTCQALGCKPA